MSEPAQFHASDPRAYASPEDMEEFSIPLSPSDYVAVILSFLMSA
jgi:hypothetical protein